MSGPTQIDPLCSGANVGSRRAFPRQRSKDRSIMPLNLIRRITSNLFSQESRDDRSDSLLGGLLANALECELAYYDNIARVLAGRLR